MGEARRVKGRTLEERSGYAIARDIELKRIRMQQEEADSKARAHQAHLAAYNRSKLFEQAIASPVDVVNDSIDAEAYANTEAHQEDVRRRRRSSTGSVVTLALAAMLATSISSRR